MRKKNMLPLTDEQIESYNNRKFCHIFKQTFCNVGDRNDSNVINDDSNDKEFGLKNDGDEINDTDNDSNDEEFDLIMFHEYGEGFDYVDN